MIQRMLAIWSILNFFFFMKIKRHVWVSSWSWWGTGRIGVQQSTGSQRVGHDWATELMKINAYCGKKKSKTKIKITYKFYYPETITSSCFTVLFFGIVMKTDLSQSCGHCWVFQICWHIECSTFTASSSRIWNSSTGIPSPPLALFVVMLSKAHLTSHSKVWL